MAETIEALINKMQKKFGSGSIGVFGENKVKVERVPIDSFNLSELFGGGYPRGRMIEIYGPESSGKTALACYLAGQCQKHEFLDGNKHNGVVAYIDVEHALDPNYAVTFGLNMDSVLFSQPDNAEQALDMACALVESKMVDMVVIDSVAALVPKAEIEGDIGDQNMGLMARLMGRACRKLQAAMDNNSATVIWINQIRSKMVAYGNPETTTGGNALKFFAAIRLTTRLEKRLEEGERQVGMISKIKSVKNKVAPPFRSCSMKIIFGKGYQVEDECLLGLVKYGIIARGGGGWYNFMIDGKSEKMQGDDKALSYLKSHPALYAKYKERLQEALLQKSSHCISKDDTGDGAEDELNDGLYEEDDSCVNS